VITAAWSRRRTRGPSRRAEMDEPIATVTAKYDTALADGTLTKFSANSVAAL